MSTFPVHTPSDSGFGGAKGFLVDAATSPGSVSTTISGALSAITAKGLVGPMTVFVAAGSYAESFTLPAGCALIGLGEVNITGTVTLTSSATLLSILDNLRITAAAGGTAVSADFGGAGTTSTVILRNVALTASTGGIGLLGAAATFRLEGYTRISCSVATGISLVSGDVIATEVTRLIGETVHFTGDQVTNTLITSTGGASGGVGVEISTLIQDFTGTSIGVNTNATGTIDTTTIFRNGVNVDNMIVTGRDGANRFLLSTDATSVNWIGRVSGTIVADTILAHTAGVTSIGLIDFPDDGVTRTTFRVVSMVAGTVTIDGAELWGGTIPLFSCTTGSGTLVVQNMHVRGFEHASGTVFSAVDFAGFVEFDSFSVTSQATSTLYSITNLGDAAICNMHLFRGQILHTGAAATIELAGGGLVIEDLFIRHTSAAAFHSIWIQAGTAANTFEWRGVNMLDHAEGALSVAALRVSPGGGGTTVTENGILEFQSCAITKQFNIPTGSATLVNLRGPVPIALNSRASPVSTAVSLYGNMATSIGMPASQRGLHIVGGSPIGTYNFAKRSMIGGGADDSLTVTLTNASTGVAATQTTWLTTTFTTQITQNSIAWTNTLLVGPGQDIIVVATAVGVNPPSQVMWMIY